MGSQITFSGFNNIDFNQILNAVMAQEQQPYLNLKAQKTAIQAQTTAFSTLATRLGTVETAASDLAKPGSLNVLRAVSSDPAAVGVSTTTGSLAGTYDVVVSELAHAQVTASTSTYSATDAVVATGGTLSLLAATRPPVAIVVTSAMTLEDVAAAINANADAPVTASVVQAAPGSYRLVLTGRSTGSAHAFTITSTLTGGEGLAFTDTDLDGTFGDSDPDNAVKASNAELTVNNVAIVSATNTVEGAIPGVSLTLSRKDPATTIGVTVSRDATAAASAIKSFVTAYNDLLKFIADQNTAASGGSTTSIGRDGLVRSLRSGIRSELMAEHASGTYKALPEVGLGFARDGTLALDETVLAAAIAANPDEIQTLFSGQTGGGGAFGALKTMIASYTGTGGLLSSVKTRLDQQVASMSSRLDRMEAQLALRRTALQIEYAAADSLMTQLTGQSSSLNSLGGQYRLF